jgi:hypothetical protein
MPCSWHQPSSGWHGRWSVANGTVAGSGYDVTALDDDGRILLDHQHIVS